MKIINKLFRSEQVKRQFQYGLFPKRVIEARIKKGSYLLIDLKAIEKFREITNLKGV